MTPGRLVYLAYYAPLAALRRSAREGGPLHQWRNARGRHAMRLAADTLPPVETTDSPATREPEICFLTGKNFWYQTAFCAWSLVRAAGRPFRFAFYDDGTIDAGFEESARRLFPGCQIVRAAETDARLDVHLPRNRFPALRGQRHTYLHLRKLTDCHAGHEGGRLVLDSDMLFFRRPSVLLDWMSTPDQPIHMVDVQDSYGYPMATLQNLANGCLPSRINVGALGLRSEKIDWEKLESACAALLSVHGTSYYLEQALSALLLSGQSAICLPLADYRVMPEEAECVHPTAVLHHYVAESKRGYFRHAWQHVLSPAGSTDAS